MLVAVEPVAVNRDKAAEMLGVSLAHFERHIQPGLRLIYSGKKRLVGVDELKRWARENAHAPVVA